MRSWRIDTYLDRLGARHPTPAGAAVAALNLAQGAALLEMVARFRLEADRAAGDIARAKDVREAALRLADADAGLVDVVAAAYALPRSSDAERGQRAAAIADALLAAAGPPAELITVGAELVGLCERMAEVGSGALLADVAAAADAAAAGLSISRTNVEADIAPRRGTAEAERLAARGRVRRRSAASAPHRSATGSARPCEANGSLCRPHPDRRRPGQLAVHLEHPRVVEGGRVSGSSSRKETSSVAARRGRAGRRRRAGAASTPGRRSPSGTNGPRARRSASSASPIRTARPAQSTSHLRVVRPADADLDPAALRPVGLAEAVRDVLPLHAVRVHGHDLGADVVGQHQPAARRPTAARPSGSSCPPAPTPPGGRPGGGPAAAAARRATMCTTRPSRRMSTRASSA